jgi:hypothetical protein
MATALLVRETVDLSDATELVLLGFARSRVSDIFDGLAPGCLPRTVADTGM